MEHELVKRAGSHAELNVELILFNIYLLIPAAFFSQHEARIDLLK